MADGSVSPNRIDAIAAPSCCPGYQASSTPATWEIHGIVTGPPVLSTTIVFGLAFATALIIAFWSFWSVMFARSEPSLSKLLANTIATCAWRAATAAADGLVPE